MYYLKIKNDEIVEAPKNYSEIITKNDKEIRRTYTKFNTDINAEKLAELGYTAFKYPKYRYHIDNGVITLSEYGAPVQTLFAKSDIIEAFASLNRLDELMNLVKSDYTFEFYWNGNINIDLNHEITMNALNLADIEIDDILAILRGA